MTETPGLPTLLREPGVVVGSRDGAPVAVHYGSDAGDLAACVRGVGLAARTDLTTIALTGRPPSLELLTRRLIGATVPVVRRGRRRLVVSRPRRRRPARHLPSSQSEVPCA